MTRKEDVIMLFDFLIELLKDNKTSDPNMTKPVGEDKISKALLTDNHYLANSADRINELFDKMEMKTRYNFDEPLLRKFLPQELRDDDDANNTGETTNKTH